MGRRAKKRREDLLRRYVSSVSVVAEDEAKVNQGGGPGKATRENGIQVKHHIIYACVGKDGKFLIQQFDYVDRAITILTKGLSKIVRCRLNLSGSKKERDLHNFIFRGEGLMCKISDVVREGYFFCVASEVDTDPRIIDELLFGLLFFVCCKDDLIPLTYYWPTLKYLLSQFKNGDIGCYLNFYWSVYGHWPPDPSIPGPSCSDLSCDGPAVVYAVVAYRSRIALEYLSWMDEIFKLDLLLADVHACEPWSPEKTFDHCVKGLKKHDYNTLIDGDYAFFICSYAISMDGCRTALQQIKNEMAKHLKTKHLKDKDSITISRTFLEEMRKILSNLVKEAEAEEKISGHQNEEEAEDGLAKKMIEVASHKRKWDISLSSIDESEGEGLEDGYI